MSLLQIALFGRVRITHRDWGQEIKLTRTLQALLAYLLLHRQRTIPRDVLADLFWGEQSQVRAHASLSTALWRLRVALEPDSVEPDTYLISNIPGEVGFNRTSRYWLDVAEFEEQTTRALALPYQSAQPGQVKELEAALGLYQGESLEGHYDDWALRERERLKAQYLNSLAYLMRYYAFQRQYAQALDYGQRILDLDPLREEIHRDKMRFYLACGQRAGALRQYETCRRLLKDELGIQPMAETQALCLQVQDGGSALPVLDPTGRLANLQETLQQLHRAVQTVAQVQAELHQAIDAISTLVQAEGN